MGRSSFPFVGVELFFAFKRGAAVSFSNRRCPIPIYRGSASSPLCPSSFLPVQWAVRPRSSRPGRPCRSEPGSVVALRMGDPFASGLTSGCGQGDRGDGSLSSGRGRRMDSPIGLSHHYPRPLTHPIPALPTHHHKTEQHEGGGLPAAGVRRLLRGLRAPPGAFGRPASSSTALLER